MLQKHNSISTTNPCPQTADHVGVIAHSPGDIANDVLKSLTFQAPLWGRGYLMARMVSLEFTGLKGFRGWPHVILFCI